MVVDSTSDLSNTFENSFDGNGYVKKPITPKLKQETSSTRVLSVIDKATSVFSPVNKLLDNVFDCIYGGYTFFIELIDNAIAVSGGSELIKQYNLYGMRLSLLVLGVDVNNMHFTVKDERTGNNGNIYHFRSLQPTLTLSSYFTINNIKLSPSFGVIFSIERPVYPRDSVKNNFENTIKKEKYPIQDVDDILDYIFDPSDGVCIHLGHASMYLFEIYEEIKSRNISFGVYGSVCLYRREHFKIRTGCSIAFDKKIGKLHPSGQRICPGLSFIFFDLLYVSVVKNLNLLGDYSSYYNCTDYQINVVRGLKFEIQLNSSRLIYGLATFVRGVTSLI